MLQKVFSISLLHNLMETDFTQQSSIPIFLSPDQLAKLLKLSKATIYRLIEKRALPFYKIGGSLRFKQNEIMEYVEKCRIKSANEYEHI